MFFNEGKSEKATLVQTENAGKGLVATKDLKRNDIIFEENPVITGPPQSLGPHFCANCSQPLTYGVLQGKNIF